MRNAFLILGIAFAVATPAMAQVGVSINIGDPGYYGRLDINDGPRPRLIYAEPVVIERVRVVQSPVYLHVPPGQAKQWGKHCRQYGACNRPVYFVDDGWYNQVYAPDYRKRHGNGPGRGPKDRHDHDDHDHDDRGPGKHGRGRDHD